MKKIIVYCSWLFAALCLSVPAVQAHVVSEEKVNREDSVTIPDPVKDLFVILTPDGLYQKGEKKKGIFCREEFALTSNLDTIRWQMYHLVSPLLSSDDPSFQHEESVARKLVVSKALLEKIKPIDINKKWAQLEKVDEMFCFMCDTLTYGTDLERVREILPKETSGKERMDIILSGKLEPYVKRVWLIDRRHITSDSMLLLEVKPVWAMECFPSQKPVVK